MALVSKRNEFENRRVDAYQFFIGKGLTPLQASATIGNLIQESQLNPKSHGDPSIPGGSRGIAQWNRDRLQSLRDTHGGDNAQLFGNQLEFVWRELNTTHKKALNALKSASNIEDATLAISKHYETPNIKYAQNNNRIKYAIDTYNKFNNKSPLSYNTPEQNLYDAGQMIKQGMEMPVGKDLFNITPKITNFDTREQSGIFASEETPTEGVPKVDAKQAEAEKVLAEKTNELNFIDELASQQEQKIKQFYSQSSQQTPQIKLNSLGQTYSQISEFVDSPVAQQGGKIYVNSINDPRYKAYQDSLKLYKGTQRTLREINSKEYAKEGDDKIGFVPISALDKERSLANVGFGDNHQFENEWFLEYDKQLNLEDAKKYIKTVKIKPEKFYKSFLESSYYRPLYKKPQQVVEVDTTPKVKAINTLQSRDLVDLPIQEHYSEIKIPNQYIQPKYWDIQDNVNQTFGGTQTNYRVTPNNIDYMLQNIAPEPYNSRTVIPHYQEGGSIKDQEGQRRYPWQITEIQGNRMSTHGYGEIPLLVKPDKGEPQIVMPNTGEYYFPNATKFTEYPINLQEYFKK